MNAANRYVTFDQVGANVIRAAHHVTANSVDVVTMPASRSGVRSARRSVSGINVMKNQRGVALFISLVLLLVLTIIGVSAVQTTSLEERMARNTNDSVLAFESAEVALRTAETFLRNNVNSTALFPPAAITDSGNHLTICRPNAGAGQRLDRREQRQTPGKQYRRRRRSAAIHHRVGRDGATVREPEPDDAVVQHAVRPNRNFPDHRARRWRTNNAACCCKARSA